MSTSSVSSASPAGEADTDNSDCQGSLLALRSIVRRVLALTGEERTLARAMERIPSKPAPQLLDQPRRAAHGPRSSFSTGHTAARETRSGSLCGSRLAFLGRREVVFQQ